MMATTSRRLRTSLVGIVCTTSTTFGAAGVPVTPIGCRARTGVGVDRVALGGLTGRLSTGARLRVARRLAPSRAVVIKGPVKGRTTVTRREGRSPRVDTGVSAPTGAIVAVLVGSISTPLAFNQIGRAACRAGLASGLSQAGLVCLPTELARRKAVAARCSASVA